MGFFFFQLGQILFTTSWSLKTLFPLSSILKVEILRESDSSYKKILFLMAYNFLFQLEYGLEFSTNWVFASG